MALLDSNYLTLTDWATRLDPNGKIPVIVEMLNQDNEILQDMPWMEGNLPTGHKHTIRTGLPTPTWRKLYGGVQPTKSETAPVTDACGMLEAYSEPDKEEADLNGNTSDFRLSEARAHMEGMSQTMASTIFYGDTDLYPERFMGLAPRYNDENAANASNIINGGGSSDCTSIWLINWGESRVSGIFPKASKAGLTHTDKGQVTVQLSDGSRYEAYQDHYQWKGGVVVKDWRYAVRIANIDVTALKHDPDVSSGDLSLFEKLAIALETIKDAGNARIYCNRKISAYVRTQRIYQKNVNIGFRDVAGTKVMEVDGVPVRRCDALLNTESAVTFS